MRVRRAKTYTEGEDVYHVHIAHDSVLDIFALSATGVRLKAAGRITVLEPGGRKIKPTVRRTLELCRGESVLNMILDCPAIATSSGWSTRPKFIARWLPDLTNASSTANSSM